MTRAQRVMLSVALGLLVLAAGTPVAAPVAARAENASRPAVYANLARNVAVPSYRRLASATAALAAALPQSCTSQSPADLEHARELWRDAWQAWNRVRVFRFGPARLAARISYPVDIAKLRAVIGGGSKQVGPPFTPESVALTGSDIRGLEAIESVLFDGDGSADACAYAGASAAIVAENADEVVQQWTREVNGQPAFAEQLAHPKGSPMYATSQHALDDLVNGMLKASTEAVSALANAIEPVPGRAPTTIHLGDRVRDNLWSVQAAYFGASGRGNGHGVDDFVAALSPSMDDRLSKALRAALASTRQLPPSLSDASPQQLRRAHAEVRKVARLLDTEVAAGLGVTINLTDTDGDS
jgi:predicted lipoprotein